ncbi:MAG: hypothetical protein GC162_05600 [Planctomycetes bacterium]|nr:hypothetical protein [Planctomycetota bacterium]
MKKVVKILLGLIVVVIVLVIAAVGIAAWKMDAIAKRGLEAGGTYALGVNTTVDSVSISLLSGTVGVKDMVVANPTGFNSKELMDFKDFSIAVETGSLFKDVIVVPSIELDDLTMNIEQAGGKTNVSVIADNLKKLGSGTADAPPAEGGSSKKVKVGSFILKNITANVQVLPIGGQASTVKVVVPELKLDNVSSDEGVPMAEVIKRVWPAILAAIVSKAGGLIPDDLLKDLQGDVMGLAQNLGGEAGKLMGQVGGPLGDQLKDLSGKLGGDVGKTVNDTLGKVLGGDKKEGDTGGATKAVDDATKKLGEGLGGLLGGDKKK